MQRRMEQLRRSHVVKQVAAGREFKGQPFTAKPDTVVFKVCWLHCPPVVLQHAYFCIKAPVSLMIMSVAIITCF